LFWAISISGLIILTDKQQQIVIGNESMPKIAINDNKFIFLTEISIFLGDMLNVDGDANAAVEARIRTGWNKFRQLSDDQDGCERMDEC